MNRKDSKIIYYFLIINQITQKEIGHIFYHHNGTIEDFDSINHIKNQTISQLAQHRHIAIKKVLVKHNVYGKSIDKDTFYFIAIKRNKSFLSYKDFINTLIKEIEHQEIKKLINSNGELSHIGVKTFMFSVDQFMDSFNKKKNKTIKLMKYFNTMMILIKMNRLIKQMIKIIENKKNKMIKNNHLDNNIIFQISHNGIHTNKEEIIQLKNRINNLYFHFILFIVIILLFLVVLLFH